MQGSNDENNKQKLNDEQVLKDKKIAADVAAASTDTSAKAPAPAQNNTNKTDATDKKEDRKASKGEKVLNALNDSVKGGKSNDAWVQQSIDMQEAIMGLTVTANKLADDVLFNPLPDKLKKAAGDVKDAAGALGNKIKNALGIGGEAEKTNSANTADIEVQDKKNDEAKQQPAVALGPVPDSHQKQNPLNAVEMANEPVSDKPGVKPEDKPDVKPAVEPPSPGLGGG